MKMPSTHDADPISGITVAVLVAAIVAGSLFAQSRRPPIPATIQLTAEQQSKADYDNAIVGAVQRGHPHGDRAAGARGLSRSRQHGGARTSSPSSRSPHRRRPRRRSAPRATPPRPSAPDPNAAGPLPWAPSRSRSCFPRRWRASRWARRRSSRRTRRSPVSRRLRFRRSPTSFGLFTTVDPRRAAQKFLDGVSKGLYSKDPAVVTVRGVTGYFGTDGTRFATVAFRRGRYVFEVIVTSSGPPADAKALAEKAAAAFPAAP